MIPDKLSETMSLCGIPPNEHENFLEIFNDIWENGSRGDALLLSLCDNGFSELREISSADEADLLMALKIFVEHGKSNVQLQNIDYYLRENERTGTIKIKEKLFADDLTTIYHFKTVQDTEELLYYEEGFYQYNGAGIIRAECEAMFGEQINSYHVSEIVNHIRRSTYIKREEINATKTILALKNGLFDLTTHALKPFNPNIIITYKLPVAYDPDVKCVNIQGFISEILDPNDIPIIQEYFGYTLLPSLPAHKSLWMYGVGRNGKSQLTLLLSKLLGAENTASVPIEEFDGFHRFSVARLFGKLANIVSEPGVKKPLRSGLFKNVVGGDRVSAETKGKQQTIDFISFAKFIILGNVFPEVTDTSLAFWDRLIVIEFPNSFVNTFIPDISEKLISADGGLSGFFNWCLEGLKRLEENGYRFSTSKKAEDMKLEFEKLSNPVTAFITEECVIDGDSAVPVQELYNAYKEYCDDGNYKILAKNTVSLQFEALRGVHKKRDRFGGKQMWCWSGIKLKAEIDAGEEDHKDKGVTRVTKLTPIILSKQKCQIEPLYGVDSNGVEFVTNVTKLKKPKSKISELTCICGKRFDTVEVLRHHQSQCKEFIAKQDREAREKVEVQID